MDRALITFEQELEWLEGLAKYAETRSAELGSEEQFSKNFQEYSVARGRAGFAPGQARTGMENRAP